MYTCVLMLVLRPRTKLYEYEYISADALCPRMRAHAKSVHVF
jgi:hypothetical protein